MESNPAIRRIFNFRQLEAATFQVFHADGAFGGPTPSGALYVAFYSQVGPIPTEMTCEITETGMIGNAISVKVENFIERRLQTGIIMDLNTAKSLKDWLGTQIAAIEAMQQQPLQKGEPS